MTADESAIPDDYRSLLAESGPGTLAGVLRLLAPGGPEGFRPAGELEAMRAAGQEYPFQPAGDLMRQLKHDITLDEEDDEVQAVINARLWGVFATGETCWWLPLGTDPNQWPVVIVGRGWQQLSMATADFLHQWADGLLDLPVLADGAVRREWHITPAGQPVMPPDVPEVARDRMAQLAHLIDAPANATPFSYDWAAIEADLGRPLPPDYKLLFDTYGTQAGDGKPYGTGALKWNGIYIHSPLSLKATHQLDMDHGMFTYVEGHPGAEGVTTANLLKCGDTDERTSLAWDTRNPDPAQWRVLFIEYLEPHFLPGTLTDVLIGAYTRVWELGYTFWPGNAHPFSE